MKRTTISDLLAWQPGRLARGTLSMATGMGVRSLAQAVVFLVVARILGVNAYGAVAAILALAGALGGLTGLGTRNLLIRDTSRKVAQFTNGWGTTLAAVIVTSPALFVLYLAMAAAILPDAIPLAPIVILGAAELLAAPTALAGVSAYQAHDRIGRAARLVLAPVLFRLCGAVSLLIVSHVLPAPAHLVVWSLLYTLSAGAAAAYALMLVHRDLGRPAWPSRSALRASLVAGLPFALGAVGLKVYTDIDKAMLAGLAGLEAAGAYSAGYRVVEMASIPVASLLMAASPALFREGTGGNFRAIVDYAVRLTPVPAIYAVAAGAGLYLLAQYVPLLLGRDFADTVSVLRWLAWLPLMSLTRLFLQYVMTAGDQQGRVVAVLVIGAAVNVALNLALIPSWGWRGAAISTYVAELTMAFVMSCMLARWSRR